MSTLFETVDGATPWRWCLLVTLRVREMDYLCMRIYDL